MRDQVSPLAAAVASTVTQLKLDMGEAPPAPRSTATLVEVPAHVRNIEAGKGKQRRKPRLVVVDADSVLDYAAPRLRDIEGVDAATLPPPGESIVERLEAAYAVRGVRGTEKAILAYIALRDGVGGRGCTPRLSSMQADCSIGNRHTVEKALRSLLEKGHIERHQPATNEPAAYYFRPPDRPKVAYREPPDRPKVAYRDRPKVAYPPNQKIKQEDPSTPGGGNTDRSAAAKRRSSGVQDASAGAATRRIESEDGGEWVAVVQDWCATMIRNHGGGQAPADVQDCLAQVKQAALKETWKHRTTRALDATYRKIRRRQTGNLNPREAQAKFMRDHAAEIAASKAAKAGNPCAGEG